MTKADLVAKTADAAGIKKSEAALAIDAFIGAIEAALAAGEEVAIKGFGTFAVTSRAARTGRNPKTGEKITIAAQKSPKFKVGKALKDAVA